VYCTVLSTLENGDVVINSALLVLRHAFGNPDDVADLLLLELDERVEHSVVELLVERNLVQFHLPRQLAPTKTPSAHLVLKESVLKRLLPRVAPNV
jgi:hypothetical protein